jgi:predicted PurR-regulated permease PerM
VAILHTPRQPDPDEAPEVSPPGGPEKPTPSALPIPLDIRSIALTGLFVLAVLYTSYFARSFIVPVIVALLLEFLLSPLVRRLRRARVPEALSGAVIVLGLIAACAFTVYSLSGPAADWMRRAPESLEKVQSKLQKLRRPVEQVTRTAEQVEELTNISARSGRVLKVELQDRSFGEVVFGGTQELLGTALVVGVLLYFLLASGDLFLTKVIRVLPTLKDKKRAVQIARETEDQISHYLVTTTVINLAFGAVVAVAMRLLGMPNPLLWGALAAVTNFVPYLGGLAAMVVLAMVALVQFDDTGRALLVPATFLALNIVEGNIVTPMLVGRQLLLNPVVIFIGVLFWGWLWGIVGSLLAVPILATFKIVCDHIEGLAPVGEFLGP